MDFAMNIDSAAKLIAAVLTGKIKRNHLKRALANGLERRRSRRYGSVRKKAARSRMGKIRAVWGPRQVMRGSSAWWKLRNERG
jgi:hypothetical protein